MLFEVFKTITCVFLTLLTAEMFRQMRLRKKVKEMVLTTVRHNLREQYGYELKNEFNIHMEIGETDIITEDNFMRYYIIMKKAIMKDIVESKGLKPIKK